MLKRNTQLFMQTRKEIRIFKIQYDLLIAINIIPYRYEYKSSRF